MQASHNSQKSQEKERPRDSLKSLQGAETRLRAVIYFIALIFLTGDTRERGKKGCPAALRAAKRGYSDEGRREPRVGVPPAVSHSYSDTSRGVV